MRSPRSSTLSGSQLAWSKYSARRRLLARGSASKGGRFVLPGCVLLFQQFAGFPRPPSGHSAPANRWCAGWRRRSAAAGRRRASGAGEEQQRRHAAEAPAEALGDVAAVAAEHLVAAVAGEHRADAARGFARDQVQRDVGRARDRRVALDHGSTRARRPRRRGESTISWCSVPKCLASAAARGSSLSRVVGEAGGKSLRRVVARGEREQRGGIDAAGEQHAGAGGAQADRFVELFGEGRDRLAPRPAGRPLRQPGPAGTSSAPRAGGRTATARRCPASACARR